MFGVEASDGSDFYSSGSVKEYVSRDTPVLFDVRLLNQPIPLSAASDVIPIAGVNNIDLLGLEYRKSVDMLTGEYSSGSLELVFHKYGGLAIERTLNAPLILKLGGQDTLVHDYSRDHKGNHAAGTVVEQTNIATMGIFLVDRKAETK
jgi:hypothetical protein